MNQVYLALSTVLLWSIVLGLIRILRGPAPADRMLAIQLFGTTGVGILLLMSEAFGLPTLRNVALVFVLLAVLAMLAFTRRRIG